MLTIAPTPFPFAASRAYSGARSSVFSNANESGSAPSPRGTLTRADQFRSFSMSKLSIPGISLAIRAGSFEDLPDDRPGRFERLLAGDLHVLLSTDTSERLFSGSCISSQTRCDGLQLSETIAPPAPRSAS